MTSAIEEIRSALEAAAVDRRAWERNLDECAKRALVCLERLELVIRQAENALGSAMAAFLKLHQRHDVWLQCGRALGELEVARGGAPYEDVVESKPKVVPLPVDGEVSVPWHGEPIVFQTIKPFESSKETSTFTVDVQGREEIDIKTTVIETPIACAKMRDLVGVVLRHMESHLETNEGLRLDKPLVEAIEALKKIRDDEMKASLGPPR